MVDYLSPSPNHRARRFSIHTRLALALLLAFAVSPSVSGAATVDSGAKASTSRDARQDAVRSIPFSKLSATSQAKINSVLKHTSIYRRLPVQKTDCDPDLYLFLVRNPEVVVNIWQVMNISKCTLERTGASTLDASDGLGTTAKLEYLHSSRDLQIIYSEGRYEGPMFSKAVQGKCLCIMRSSYSREANGRHYVTSRLDTFIRLDNVGVELLAKTFQPIVGRAADYNFTETTRFVGSLSRTAEIHGEGVERLAVKLDHVTPERRNEFVTLSSAVAERNALDPDKIVEPELPRLTSSRASSDVRRN